MYRQTRHPKPLTKHEQATKRYRRCLANLLVAGPGFSACLLRLGKATRHSTAS